MYPNRAKTIARTSVQAIKLEDFRPFTGKENQPLMADLASTKTTIIG
jgi:hypothetical protein